MKNRNKKKAFTIVELVIVIAVIGVLTAILIPTFVNLTNKANNAADESLVKNLNTQLRMKETTEGKNRVLTEALDDALEIGYKVENLTPKGDRDILWDQEKDEFTLAGDSVPSDAYKYWKVYEKAADIPAVQTYSIYAKGTEWTTAPTLTVGFDVGHNEGIAKLVYDRSSASSAIEARIRTNSVSTETEDANLSITVYNRTDTSDTIRHYGIAGYVHVIQGGSHSFHTHGTVGFAKVERGRFVADSGAVVKQAYVTTSEALLTKEGNGVYENTPYAATEAIKDGHEGVPLQYDSEATEEGIKDEGIRSVEPVAVIHVSSETDIYNCGHVVVSEYTRDHGHGSTHALEISEAVTFVFESDFTISKSFFRVLPNALLTLDLNGHSIRMQDLTIDTDLSDGPDTAQVYVCPGAELNLIDSSQNGTGKIVSGDAFCIIWNEGIVNIRGGDYWLWFFEPAGVGTNKASDFVRGTGTLNDYR